MKRTDEFFELSATDLVAHLNCRHLSELEFAAAEGALARPETWDPYLQILGERGAAHEEGYVAHLIGEGLNVVRIDGVEVSNQAVSDTLAAMTDGAEVIVQGALSHDHWVGRADILRRVEGASRFGSWSYEAMDTKLTRETKAGTVLQLCVYSELLEKAQGRAPEYMHVVVPWSDFEPRRYRFADYAAYFRNVQRGLLTAMAERRTPRTYPEPVEHCDLCRWRETCDKRRRDDDHLCLVAGISRLQINELKQQGVATLQDLAGMPLPLDWKPDRGSPEAYGRVREQARIQFESRETGEKTFELLPVEEGFGLSLLPEPSDGDIFFDLEGDPFVGEHGLEYLFGYVSMSDTGEPVYRGEWALSRVEEKEALENFVDFVMDRWEWFPGMHVYHYAPYEPSALKRLMGRYATRQEEVDQMLRAGLFVDLYQVVRRGVRAGVESYSIKRLEPFCGFERQTSLADANAALVSLQATLELDDAPSVPEEVKATVLAYNKDDCLSASGLRQWLETLRSGLVAADTDVPRPQPGEPDPNERITDWQIKIAALVDKLTADVPVDPEERDDEQQARWILAYVLDWHRREEKAVWWEYFRLAGLSAEDLLDERAGLSGLTFVREVPASGRLPVHRYRFPAQETELRGGEDLRNAGGEQLGSVETISFDEYTVDIRRRKDSVVTHPEAVFAHLYVNTQVQKDALVRIGEHVAEHGLCGEGPYQAARDLLLREIPRVGGEALRLQGETTVQAAIRLCGHLTSGILPIQGPPGAGKTFTGARMICELVRQGKTVGVTANSHKVIRNLIDAALDAAEETGMDLQCCHKADGADEPRDGLSLVAANKDLFGALEAGVSVGGGTAWLWSRPEAFETLDVLFVDEAAQMSLANVLAVSHAARTVVLIGDPQQLDQPTQGSHPDGTDVSALDHILAGEKTLSPDKGLFLPETWRLHPDISAYTSELFYEGKLGSRVGLDQQVIRAQGPVSGSGLRYLPVEHHGNQNCSPEEAEVLRTLVNGILEGGATWIDRDGRESPVTLNDIVIITPYNAQVFEIQRRLPGARVGTVDKFQGQEAPIAIYSTATSSHADAPRGMEFLYSLNRLNVATSRAKCLSILVGSPQLFEAECRTPRQMQLANAFCRYLEMVEVSPAHAFRDGGGARRNID